MRVPGLGVNRPLASVVAAAAVLATVPLALSSPGAQAAPASGGARHLYIVQVAGNPLASYSGSLQGLKGTRPARGETIDVRSTAARAYSGHLRTEHAATLARAGIDSSHKVDDYSVAFNGYAASLTAAEVATLRKTPGVTRVWKDEIRSADTISTPTFLGLDGAGGTWAKKFGGPANAGKRIIVGVLDSGFWPENPAFAALPTPRSDQKAINAKWHGTCDPGIEDPVTCNNKVLGARYYNAGGLAQDYEFLSPRDYNGHGSHTASTAAGNNGVPASINGGFVGNISGMAPAARLAIYKVLWHNAATGGANGTTVDIVAAIDQAVADGVDVINYSISGSSLYVVSPDEVAFFNAAAAGVFVATSAGNDGPDVSTVAHNAPWTMTVAASTHDRGNTKTVTLGNGATYDGVGVGPALASSPLIDSTNAALAGHSQTDAQLCFIGALDPAQVAGKIVLCQRGVNGRVEKGDAVQQAGGVGMILFNASPQGVVADFQAVPSIHVDSGPGLAIKGYIAGAGASATAAISAQSTDPVEAPEMADFSSTGPALAGGGDLLKPDITAPGVDVIAAVSPANGGNMFNAESGTSMSSPHIAGIAALIKSKHPKWTPMWIKSALMTNATTLDNAGVPIQRGGADATPLDYGSGHVRPGLAFNPGVVYSSGPSDWAKYGCAIGQFQLITDPSYCAALPVIDPSDLNYPSIAVGDLAGAQTVTRTLTNITKPTTKYTPTVQAPPGFTAVVTPKTLTIPGGQSRSYSIKFTRTTATFGEFSFGSITWADRRGHAARSPIALRAQATAVPTEVSVTGASGSTNLAVRPGFTGTLTSATAGMVQATVTPFDLDAVGPSFNPAAPAASSATGATTVNVPAGTLAFRAATYDADYPANTDVDLFVYHNGALVGQSAGGTADESVTLSDPDPGSYDVYVNLFTAPGPGTTLTVQANTFVLDASSAGNLTASPASQPVTGGTPTTVGVSWSGLTPGARYLGAVLYGDGSSTIARSLVSAN